MDENWLQKLAAWIFIPFHIEQLQQHTSYTSYFFLAKDIGMGEESLEELRNKNENLLQIIHQMKEDMEDLTKRVSQHAGGAVTKTESGVPITEGDKDLKIRVTAAHNHLFKRIQMQ